MQQQHGGMAHDRVGCAWLACDACAWLARARRQELRSAVEAAFKDPTAAKAHAAVANQHLDNPISPHAQVKRMAQCVATHLRATGHHYPCSHDPDLPVNPGESCCKAAVSAGFCHLYDFVTSM